MRVVRETAREHVRVEVLRDALVHDHRADRRVARREPLGDRDHVRRDAPVLEAERRADAAEAREHLVSDEQRALWVEKGYGLGPQQAISEALMGIWTGFPTKQQSPSGKASKRTG